ncbi:NADH-quinone oxidoreductase subunit L [Marinobacter sp. NSM]|uniref:NADH-quinone oxidoreductase subunit L n=1 Tax=Marinobacter sp. NSM TaxID=3458004 RepID=UPI00403544A1
MPTITSVFSTSVLATWLALPILLLALAGFANWTQSKTKIDHCWRLAECLLQGLVAVTGVVGFLLLLKSAGLDTRLPELGAPLGLYPDGLSVWMALMVSFVSWVILRYSRDYLRGDAAFPVFLPWFLTTVASVLVLVFTNHLLVLAFAWIGVSLALHQLLTLYPDRAEARLAAAQKFITSRLGDLAIIGAVVFIWRHYGSFRIPEIYALAGEVGASSPELTIASVLLAIAAVLKCAQIPFHGWLIRVMEAPTPVSALLHAGVINLGGFLWLRLFPVFEGFTAGHFLLLLAGGVTAIVAVFAMMTQSSVKHALVWSTNAQMGFMLFEIALGAYTLALLHLLAHSLYKAHSLLASGRAVRATAVYFSGRPSVPQLVLAGLASGLAAATLWLLPGLVEHKPILAALLVLAVAASVLGMPSGSTARARVSVVAMAFSLVPLYGLLNLVLGPAVTAVTAFELWPVATLLAWLMLGILAVMSLLILLVPDWSWLQRLNLPLSQGLYLDQPFERVTRRWASQWLQVGKEKKGHARYVLTSGESS